jgi:DNA topoisomerase-1
VLAALVRVIETTYIRIGNPRYRKRNKSYGLTTMLRRHLTIEGQTVRLHFTGKSGKEVDVSLEDRRLARILKRCRELPGKSLFQYHINGTHGCVGSGDVNDYLHEIAGERFTAKDFRTWGGTIVAAESLLASGPAETKTAIKRNVVAAIKETAAALGNTPATCRKYYVHPAVTMAYENGTLAEQMESAFTREGPHQLRGLKRIERGVLAVILDASDDAFRQWIEDAA